MDRFCHCERNLEFRGGNLNLDQLPKLIFHALYYSKICWPPFFDKILKVVPKWGDGDFWNFEQFRDLTWGGVEASLQDKGSPLRPS